MEMQLKTYATDKHAAVGSKERQCADSCKVALDALLGHIATGKARLREVKQAMTVEAFIYMLDACEVEYPDKFMNLIEWVASEVANDLCASSAAGQMVH